jgi:hypothetical protein
VRGRAPTGLTHGRPGLRFAGGLACLTALSIQG